ncbi:hypothetical protein FIBSPDRAFT_934811 [Athelia psychrophila]|uniref:Glycopeptide n=1 Tax=Athelia psychrophila TaxID=1759441 RepID=A0A166ET29_9AGAM|nr:hypothetical protein FIBSPDRAFT_934811 [Fibularhizoctonia sp. CBS 109695]
MFSRATAIAIFAALAGIVSAGHSVGIVNNCGSGTPMMDGPDTGLINVSGGYSTSGDMTGWIIYLQTGQCGANGENCLTVEGTLNGGFSSVDISDIAPHAINVPTAFSYTNGAGGKYCASGNCPCNDAAFCQPTDYGAQVGSSDPNASITITFC